MAADAAQTNTPVSLSLIIDQKSYGDEVLPERISVNIKMKILINY